MPLFLSSRLSRRRSRVGRRSCRPERWRHLPSTGQQRQRRQLSVFGRVPSARRVGRRYRRPLQRQVVFSEKVAGWWWWRWGPQVGVYHGRCCGQGQWWVQDWIRTKVQGFRRRRGREKEAQVRPQKVSKHTTFHMFRVKTLSSFSDHQKATPTRPPTKTKMSTITAKRSDIFFCQFYV